MVDLYKHKRAALKHLEKTRLNPDFVKNKEGGGERKDLEFYLP
jgi:hypothetical protein